MAFIENRVGDCVFMTSSLLSSRHMFTTRLGGVSEGVYESWNLGENRGDDLACVRENFRRAGALMGTDADGFVITKQVHGTEVRIASDADRHTVGEAVPYAADGLVTARSGLALMVFIADCVTVLLEDAQAGVIAAVHCGWRSSVGDFLGVAVRKMCALGAEPSRICAAIGESIGACCFETDADVPEAVENYLSGDTAGLIFPQPDGKFKVDLRGANRRRLLSLGLRPENIDVSDECTMCSRQKYWSHRATNGVRGTQAATIILP